MVEVVLDIVVYFLGGDDDDDDDSTGFCSFSYTGIARLANLFSDCLKIQWN